MSDMFSPTYMLCPQCKATYQFGTAHICKAYTETFDTANATQVGGTHYQSKTIQPWDFIAANQLGFFEGNAIKYLSRWREKNGVEDLKKARHYIDKLIELQSDK